ncbi:MAG: hypothetical protein K6U14_06325 [Firmicutes bacterium]|nr:hypothetical protein [Alicyclobacillaceae bacterium]MCL6497236.1 hypothetical protein [Bacillota bacterium]
MKSIESGPQWLDPWPLLAAAVRRDRLAASVLLIGPQAETSAAAEALARVCLCEETGRRDCRCRACQVELAQHPDAVFIRPDPKSIRREAVAAAVERARMFPLWGRRVVVAVFEADRMTVEAQNHLLKVLEEPPPHLTALLTTDAPDRVLPTVLSRCQRWRIGGQKPVQAPETVDFRDPAADWGETLVTAAYLLRRRYLETGRPDVLQLWDDVIRLYRDWEHHGNPQMGRALIEEAWRRVRP